MTSKKQVSFEAPKEEKPAELAPYPREIPQVHGLRRVGRPLRPIRYIPTKALVFFSKNHEPQFTYEHTIGLPIADNHIIVQIHNISLNPVDLKIYNSYTSNMNGATEFGREYAGKITHIGSKVTDFAVGDEVMGLFFHPSSGKATSISSIEINPSTDVVLHKPSNLSMQEASGFLFCFATAFQALEKCQHEGILTRTSNILINSGSSSVGMQAIQLLKRFYKVSSKLVIIASPTGREFIAGNIPETLDDIFINYQDAPKRKIHKPLLDMINNKEIVEYIEGQPVSTSYNQGKFDIILDFYGGYDLVSYSSSLMNGKLAKYITTVGDKEGNYARDVYSTWDSATMKSRALFGSLLWSLNYEHMRVDTRPGDWVGTAKEILETGVCKVFIDRTYAWKDHVKAFDYLRMGHAHGKVILDVELF